MYCPNKNCKCKNCKCKNCQCSGENQCKCD